MKHNCETGCVIHFKQTVLLLSFQSEVRCLKTKNSKEGKSFGFPFEHIRSLKTNSFVQKFSSTQQGLNVLLVE